MAPGTKASLLAMASRHRQGSSVSHDELGLRFERRHRRRRRNWRGTCKERFAPFHVPLWRTTFCIGEDAESRDSLPLATGVGDWRSWMARGVCIGNLADLSTSRRCALAWRRLGGRKIEQGKSRSASRVMFHRCHWQVNFPQIWQTKMQQFCREFFPPGRVPECWIRHGFGQPVRTEIVLFVVADHDPSFLRRRSGPDRRRIW